MHPDLVPLCNILAGRHANVRVDNDGKITMGRDVTIEWFPHCTDEAGNHVPCNHDCCYGVRGTRHGVWTAQVLDTPQEVLDWLAAGIHDILGVL